MGGFVNNTRNKNDYKSWACGKGGFVIVGIKGLGVH